MHFTAVFILLPRILGMVPGNLKWLKVSCMQRFLIGCCECLAQGHCQSALVETNMAGDKMDFYCNGQFWEFCLGFHFLVSMPKYKIPQTHPERCRARTFCRSACSYFLGNSFNILSRPLFITSYLLINRDMFVSMWHIVFLTTHCNPYKYNAIPFYGRHKEGNSALGQSDVKTFKTHFLQMCFLFYFCT